MIKQQNIRDLPAAQKDAHPAYSHVKKSFLPFGEARQCHVSVYEVPPQKAAYPYHYHHKNEEVFYILSGEGVLRTPEGERPVMPGELIYFPADASGAHKLTNTSDSEMLVYIDFDTSNDIDVCVYPDSGKLGVWGKGINRVYPADGDVDYYQGE